MFKAVFLDVDGTLTDLRSNTVPDSAGRAIRLARERGVKVCVATGRHTRTKEEGSIIAGLDFDCYISLSGQLCYASDGGIYHKQTLDPKIVRRMLRLSDRLWFPCVFSERDSIYANRIDQVLTDAFAIVDIRISEARKPERMNLDEIYLMCPVLKEEHTEEVFSSFQDCVVTQWKPEFVDIMPTGCGKHIGLEKTLEYLGIDVMESIAFGDAQNDVTMLQYAGLGVAMSDGSPEALEVADYIAPPVAEDGIYRAFEKFGII